VSKVSCLLYFVSRIVVVWVHCCCLGSIVVVLSPLFLSCVYCFCLVCLLFLSCVYCLISFVLCLLFFIFCLVSFVFCLLYYICCVVSICLWSCINCLLSIVLCILFQLICLLVIFFIVFRQLSIVYCLMFLYVVHVLCVHSFFCLWICVSLIWLNVFYKEKERVIYITFFLRFCCWKCWILIKVCLIAFFFTLLSFTQLRLTLKG